VSDPRHALLEAFRRHGVKEGEFTLSAGGTSKWYLDGRLVTFRGDCQPVIGRAVLDTLAAAGVTDFDAVGGMTLGADPVSIAVATAASLRAFSVRKEPKGHGVGGRFAGPVSAEDRVLVVDDTATTGSSLLQAIDAVEELGCPIVAATVLLDRGGVLAAKLRDKGIPYFPVLGAPDLGYEFGS
jgi:orotate phosphoribosyltransferase